MFEEIKKVLVDAINVDEEEIKPEAKLNDDLGIDSWPLLNWHWNWKMNSISVLKMKNWLNWKQFRMLWILLKQKRSKLINNQ